MPRGSHVAVRLRDKESFDALREIVRYEAAVRGLTIGETVYELVMGAIDAESYPEEVRAHLSGGVPGSAAE